MSVMRSSNTPWVDGYVTMRADRSVLCASTSSDDLKMARRILAEHPHAFTEHFLEARGLPLAAEFVRREAGRQPAGLAAAEYEDT